MATTPAARRAFDTTNLEELVRSLEKQIVDLEFAERLASNADWELLGKWYRRELEPRMLDLDTLKAKLHSTPMAPEQAVRMREEVMMLERDRINAEDFLNFPARAAKELKMLREQVDDHRERLHKIKGEDHA